MEQKPDIFVYLVVASHSGLLYPEASLSVVLCLLDSAVDKFIHNLGLFNMGPFNMGPFFLFLFFFCAFPSCISGVHYFWVRFLRM